MDGQAFPANLDYVFYVFFCYIIKVKHFCDFFIILLHLMSSFLHSRSLLIPCAYVSIESIDRILLSSFEIEAILLNSSVKAFCFSLLNLCYVFSISLLFFMNSYLTSLRLPISNLFFLNGLVYFRFERLLNIFHNLQN